MGDKQSFKGVVTLTFEVRGSTEEDAQQVARRRLMRTLKEHAISDKFDIEDVSVVPTLESDIESELDKLEKELERS